MTAPVDSIVELLQALVRASSRATEDDLTPVLLRVEAWMDEHQLAHHRVAGADGQPLGLYAEVSGRKDTGRWTILNATLDTAAFGDSGTWRHGPTDAVIDGGWLHGRGSADSKAGVAIFVHLLRELAGAGNTFTGRVGVLFDLDEHSGRFGGARAFFDRPFNGGKKPRPDGVFIGYPGMDRIVTGGRGFLRARVRVHGVAAHSGASRSRGVNALSRAVLLANALDAIARTLPSPPPGSRFPLKPQLTLTGMHGGDEGFSQVPDLCEIRLDLRLTPLLGNDEAQALVEQALRETDAQPSSVPVAPTEIDWIEGWPAYQLEEGEPMVLALREAGAQVLGLELPTAVVGPSNIGNYLHTLGVPALCGFGVREENIHAANERIEIASIEPVYRTYREALRRLHRI